MGRLREKQPLLPRIEEHPPPPPPPSPPATFSPRLHALLILIPGVLLSVLVFFRLVQPLLLHAETHSSPETCPQVNPLYPQNYASVWTTIGNTIDTDAFKQEAVDKLAGAVRIPSEVFDAMGPVDKDARWNIFGDFHEYLRTSFPLVHEKFTLQKVNTYGLLYEWRGSDASLKPILLAGHQDVVPVHPSTVSDWTHPPFSGHFDGRSIWGRGSSDDKSGVIGLMIAFEHLIANGFTPTRSLVLAFGFDEESMGLQGASSLGKKMEDIYGEDAFAFIIDEGGHFSETYDGVFAFVGIAEKGYVDIKLEVSAPGGHSSVPPVHTSIGMLSKMLVELERDPPSISLSRQDVHYGVFQCFGEHGHVPQELEDALKAAPSSDKALGVVENYVFANPVFRAAVATTQAIDLVNGGVKANALPEVASAVINHRVAALSSVEETRRRDAAVIKAVAHEFNLSFTAFGQPISPHRATSKGHVSLEDAFNNALEPAPRTPVSGPEALPYQILSGTIKSAYNAHRNFTDDSIVVVPGMATGNGDTRYYWKLSRHIFRYGHKNAFNAEKATKSGVHTVNEHIEVEAFLEIIRFFTTLVLNSDEAEL
ncbi:carboxypeptidase S [Cylindrobasidium torrendii FP15055 ss-10]|uniref:Carboxypeptidase S n=1 Tax=Cylindrobasidium torrendii FP15055 ss-10 TaxID=1314674 RepID=A0A0D7B6C0_9AGAR|nr:carboxypeptidase S [Cylindrobasidium torrendii FP15055 ss-10]